MKISATTAARNSCPARTSLDKHARSLWIGKRLVRGVELFTISHVALTSNGLEIQAKDANGALRIFPAAKILSTNIF